MNHQNWNQLPASSISGGFTTPVIQGQPNGRSRENSNMPNITNLTQFRSFGTNFEAHSYVNNVLNNNGASTATIREAYRFQGSPADILPLTASPTSVPPASSPLVRTNNVFASRQPVQVCGPISQVPVTADTLMVVCTAVVPNRQPPPPSCEPFQNGAAGRRIFAPPNTPVSSGFSINSGDSSHSSIARSSYSQGCSGVGVVSGNSPCSYCGSFHVGSSSSSSSEYSPPGYTTSSSSGYSCNCRSCPALANKFIRVAICKTCSCLKLSGKNGACPGYPKCCVVNDQRNCFYCARY